MTSLKSSQSCKVGRRSRLLFKFKQYGKEFKCAKYIRKGTYPVSRPHSGTQPFLHEGPMASPVTPQCTIHGELRLATQSRGHFPAPGSQRCQCATTTQNAPFVEHTEVRTRPCTNGKECACSHSQERYLKHPGESSGADMQDLKEAELPTPSVPPEEGRMSRDPLGRKGEMTEKYHGPGKLRDIPSSTFR